MTEPPPWLLLHQIRMSEGEPTQCGSELTLSGMTHALPRGPYPVALLHVHPPCKVVLSAKTPPTLSETQIL